MCTLPRLDMDPEEGVRERQLAYLRSIIEENRDGVRASWQFGFDLIWGHHSRGILYVVESGSSVTTMWELREDTRWQKKGAKASGPPPGVNNVWTREVGIRSLTAEDLLAGMATLSAVRIMES